MIDLHTHVIPYVDDGSPSLEESIKMVKSEVEQGITTIVCTPHHMINHYEKSIEEITNRIKGD